MDALRKRFSFWYRSCKLNVSAGLPVPLMSDCNQPKNRVTTDTISTVTQLQSSLKPSSLTPSTWMRRPERLTHHVKKGDPARLGRDEWVSDTEMPILGNLGRSGDLIRSDLAGRLASRNHSRQRTAMRAAPDATTVSSQLASWQDTKGIVERLLSWVSVARNFLKSELISIRLKHQ